MKFHIEWTFYGKLVFKRCLDVEDWFRDKVAVQYRIPFQMDLLQKVNLYQDAKFSSKIRSRFRTKFHFK